jgi:chemotaxis response regulator CheB
LAYEKIIESKPVGIYLAQRLDSKSKIKVQEATTGLHLEPGNTYLAPGDIYLEIKERSGHWVTFLNDTDKVTEINLL